MEYSLVMVAVYPSEQDLAWMDVQVQWERGVSSVGTFSSPLSKGEIIGSTGITVRFVCWTCWGI